VTGASSTEPPPVGSPPAPSGQPLLCAVDVVKHFHVGRGAICKAVDGVSFDIRAGETVGLVGESGCGKSTLARVLTQLLPATSGQVLFEGLDLTRMHGESLRQQRKHLQVIFQDPFASLDPRMTVGDIIAEPLTNFGVMRGKEKDDRVQELLRVVGLNPYFNNRYPHEFSGGQRQRIGIARALALNPKLIVCDEPVSALDVSIQAQVLNLMSDLQREAGVTYLLISHDLAVVGHICDEIAVMFHGRFVETGPSAALLRLPAHPYTRELVDAEPKLEETPLAPSQAPPRPDATTGCPYAARCLYARARCLEEAPALRGLDDTRRVACHFPLGG
jgi:oligopeptide/dipeptide ABC transporter ATP-binding protein